MEQLELLQLKDTLQRVKSDCGDSIRMHRAKSAIKRMEILKALELKKRMTMTELAQAVSLKAATVSRHVKELLNANLVYVNREGKNSYVTINEENNHSPGDG